MCAVLSIGAVAFTQEQPDTPALMPVHRYIYGTHHPIPTVTRAICGGDQPFQNTGVSTRDKKTKHETVGKKNKDTFRHDRYPVCPNSAAA